MTPQILIIVNNIPPYGAELVNVMAQPEGGTARFRYQKKYAPTIQNVAGLKTKMGSIVLRNRTNGEFMPLRSCQIISSDEVGDIIYLSVRLLAIAAITSPSGTESGDRQLREFCGLVTNAIGEHPNPTNDELLNLVLYDNAGRVNAQLVEWNQASNLSDPAHWGNCVSYICNRFGLNGIDFLKIVSVTSSKGRVVAFSSIKRLGWAYKLIAGETYTINILQRTYTGRTGDSSLPSNRLLQVQSSNERVRPLWGTTPILGKYDLIQTPIEVVHGATSGPAQLFLRIVDSTGESAIPALDLPVRVQLPLLTVALRWSSAALFLALLTAYIASTIVAGLFPERLGVVEAQVEKLCLIGMIITSIPLGFGRVKEYVNRADGAGGERAASPAGLQSPIAIQ